MPPVTVPRMVMELPESIVLWKHGVVVLPAKMLAAMTRPSVAQVNLPPAVAPPRLSLVRATTVRLAEIVTVYELATSVLVPSGVTGDPPDGASYHGFVPDQIVPVHVVVALQYALAMIKGC